MELSNKTMGKDTTYNELRKSMNRIKRLMRGVAALTNLIVFILNFEKSKGFIITALVFSILFEIVYYFVISHIMIAFFIAFLLVAFPIQVMTAIVNVIGYTIQKQGWFYTYWRNRINAPLADYYFLKTKLGVERSVRTSKNFRNN